MVFSQTSHKTRSILKVVELDRLKAGKSQQVNDTTGGVADGYSFVESTPPSPVATTSFSEVYLKPDNKMFHDSNSESFQDLSGLLQWTSSPAVEDLLQTIDSTETEKRALSIDTPQTLFSPQGCDPISPYAQTGIFNTFVDHLSPTADRFIEFDNEYLGLPDLHKENKTMFPEQFLDINNLSVVIGEGDEMPERGLETYSWPMKSQLEWDSTIETDNTQLYTNTHNITPFIYQEDSLDLKLGSVQLPQREVENNDVVLSEYIVEDDVVSKGVLFESDLHGRNGALTVDVAARNLNSSNEVISTPEVLCYVEQLEKEKCSQIMKTKQLWPVQETTTDVLEPTNMDIQSPEHVTLKSESHIESDQDDAQSPTSRRRRRDSDDSDYSPYIEQTPRKSYKRRKPNVPIKEMILALEGSQQLTKARRGRPPKRRESTVSSVCSIDENSSCASTHETKYRELRDKNNEASKRSRMNRKLKELQMEQLATDLEEKNKKLKVKADILEEMTKKLKEALMTAILHK